MKLEKVEQLDKELKEIENKTINIFFDKLYIFIGFVIFIFAASILLTFFFAEKTPDMLQVALYIFFPLLFTLFVTGYIKDKINNKQFYDVAINKNIMDKYVNIFETPKDLEVLKANLIMNNNNLTYGFVMSSVDGFLTAFKNEACRKEAEMKSEEIIKSFHKQS